MAAVSLTTVFTDGATSKNGNSLEAKGGIGVWFGHDDPRNVSEPFLGESPPTNQKCELMAILRAIESAVAGEQDCSSLMIKTDSKYSIGCLTKWYHNWQRNGWKNSKGDDVKNKELIDSILKAIEKAPFSIHFEYVKGHASGSDDDAVGNRMADLLAVRGREGEEQQQSVVPFLAISLENDAIMPTQNEKGGWNLFARHPMTLEPNRFVFLRTGVTIEIPKGYKAYSLSLSENRFIDVLSNCVSEKKDGWEIYLEVINRSETPIHIQKETRIARVAIAKESTRPWIKS